jgi:hypothetical protein
MQRNFVNEMLNKINLVIFILSIHPKGAKNFCGEKWLKLLTRFSNQGSPFLYHI